MNEWIIKIVDPGYKFTREIFIFKRLPDGKLQFLGEDNPTGIGETHLKPTIELEPEQLQAFANALADNGFKPQEGFVEGELKATKEHLKDLKKILKL